MSPNTRSWPTILRATAQRDALPAFIVCSSRAGALGGLLALLIPKRCAFCCCWRVTGGRLCCERLANNYNQLNIRRRRQTGGMKRCAHSDQFKSWCEANPPIARRCCSMTRSPSSMFGWRAAQSFTEASICRSAAPAMRDLKSIIGVRRSSFPEKKKETQRPPRTDRNRPHRAARLLPYADCISSGERSRRRSRRNGGLGEPQES